MSKLTKKQESFCLNYVDTLNASDAYRKAGYSKGQTDKTVNENSCRLLKNSKVKARVDELREEITKPIIEKFKLTKEWVVEQLVDNVSISKALEPVKDSDGNNIGEYRTNIPAANKALELLGKEIGMFVERKEITGANGGAIKTESTVTMSAEDAYKTLIGKD